MTTLHWGVTPLRRRGDLLFLTWQENQVSTNLLILTPSATLTQFFGQETRRRASQSLLALDRHGHAKGVKDRQMAKDQKPLSRMDTFQPQMVALMATY